MTPLMINPRAATGLIGKSGLFGGLSAAPLGHQAYKNPVGSEPPIVYTETAQDSYDVSDILSEEGVASVPGSLHQNIYRSSIHDPDTSSIQPILMKQLTSDEPLAGRIPSRTESYHSTYTAPRDIPNSNPNVPAFYQNMGISYKVATDQPSSYQSVGYPSAYQSVGQPSAYQSVGQPSAYQSVGQPSAYQSVGQPSAYQSVGQPSAYQSVGQPSAYQSVGQPSAYKSIGQPNEGQPSVYQTVGQPSAYQYLGIMPPGAVSPSLAKLKSTYTNTGMTKKKFCVDNFTEMYTNEHTPSVMVDPVGSGFSNKFSVFDEGPVLQSFVAPPVMSMMGFVPEPTVLNAEPIDIVAEGLEGDEQQNYEVTMEEIPMPNGESRSRISIRATPNQPKTLSPSTVMNQMGKSLASVRSAHGRIPNPSRSVATTPSPVVHESDIDSIGQPSISGSQRSMIKTRPSVRNMPTIAGIEKSRRLTDKSLSMGGKPKSQVHFDIDIVDSQNDRTIVLTRSVQSQSKVNTLSKTASKKSINAKSSTEM